MTIPSCILRIATFALVACAICACAPNAAYRTRIASDTGLCVGSPGACAAEVWQRLDSSDPAHPVYLGFVEFDDQGALHHPELKDELMARIRALRRAHPLLIVVFAHGWKHNASASDANVVEIAGILQRIADGDQRVCAGQPCAARRVVGIYLGWRGLSTSAEPLKALSFWTRKSRAHRVGTDGATEVLADLKKISAGNAHDRLILAGHSFGGALIYTAIQQQLMRDTAFPKNDIVAREVADLIVLVNPAFEAARFRALHRRVRGMEHSDKQRPILAVFTSRNDTATRTAFPIGRSLNTIFQQHSSDEHGVAQQRGVVAGKRRHHQHRRIVLQLGDALGLVGKALEAQQSAERLRSTSRSTTGYSRPSACTLWMSNVGFS